MPLTPDSLIDDPHEIVLWRETAGDLPLAAWRIAAADAADAYARWAAEPGPLTYAGYRAAAEQADAAALTLWRERQESGAVRSHAPRPLAA